MSPGMASKISGLRVCSSQKELRSVTHEKETSFKAIFWVRSVENRALGAHFSKPSPDKGRCLN